jgi:hypothetical protein
MYVQTPDQLFSLAVLLACCGLAVWRGRWVERIAAAAMAVAWFVSPLVQDDQQTLGPERRAVVDILLLLVLLSLALTSDRWWTMAATAFQGVAPWSTWPPRSTSRSFPAPITWPAACSATW